MASSPTRRGDQASFRGLQTQELITHARPRPEHVMCQLGDPCFHASTHAVLCPLWEGAQLVPRFPDDRLGSGLLK